jgi:type I restriction enzyme R subunit
MSNHPPRIREDFRPENLDPAEILRTSLIAEVRTDEQRMFILWAVKVLFCTRAEDFKENFGNDIPVERLIEDLEEQGFLQRDDAELVLTTMGERAVSHLKDLSISELADRDRPAKDVQRRFSQKLNEATLVEDTFIEQLKGLGWQHISGDRYDPQITERDSFRDVLLEKRLRAALLRVNKDDAGSTWLDEHRINTAVDSLARLGPLKLIEANKQATELLLKGVKIEGDAQLHRGREQTVRYIDFENPANNDFLVVNQFRVDVPGSRKYVLPDIVLFINGVPLVVVECKSPASTNPVEEGISDLLDYTGLSEREFAHKASAEKLFHYNQLLISTCFYEARVGTIGSSYEHFLEWKDTAPVPPEKVAAELGVERLSSQQMLVAGMLRPEHLLDIIQNFLLFQQTGERTIKIVAHYHQFRAVRFAVERLMTAATRLMSDDLTDKRGGIIWHTQGSGKSLTMVFLICKMRTLPELRRFKVVMVTDRTDLEKQLKGTAILTGETVRPTRADARENESPSAQLQRILREDGPDLVFAMIQKYQTREDAEDEEAQEVEAEQFPVLNDSPDILVLVDEAHRSQAKQLHANLRRALPNAARIGFTGTPIMIGESKKTHEIFGSFIDRYSIAESEEDGATLPILYEGRGVPSAVTDDRTLDELVAAMFADRTGKEIAKIQERYATLNKVLEAEDLIATKAADMLWHYVDNILPNGFKAQVVAVSRRAAARYQEKLKAAHEILVGALTEITPSLLALTAEERERLDAETQFLLRAHPHFETIKRLEFATVVSNHNPNWKEWSDKSKIDARIARFRKPLIHVDSEKQDGLAFLCVRTMLLTGFDAPIEQVLYLDRFMQGHELLQAIARVNRTYPGKTHGLVVDYYGVTRYLKAALAVYNAKDVRGVLDDISDELPVLADRHRRVVDVFRERGIPDYSNVNDCVELLRDLKIRADFTVKYKKFLESLDIVLPRSEALPFVEDAKRLGFINKSAANLYRDDELNLIGVGRKVQGLIDEHIRAQGVEPLLPPVRITDDSFDRTVDLHTSNRTKASEMEHALRYHITQNYERDPVLYKKLSERLEEILKRFEDNWAEQVVAFGELRNEVRQEHDPDDSELDPRTEAPFFRLLREAVAGDGETTESQVTALRQAIMRVVKHLRAEIVKVGFWQNLYAQNLLRQQVVQILDDYNLMPYERLLATADRIVELARTRHSDLIA